METKKEEEVEKKKEVDRKPKYIKQLLKSAEIRNKEFLNTYLYYYLIEDWPIFLTHEVEL